jgi:hypothetical protein
MAAIKARFQLDSSEVRPRAAELQRHAEELKQSPSECMPWNYRETLARLATPAAAQYDESCRSQRIDCGQAGAGTQEWPEAGPPESKTR